MHFFVSNSCCFQMGKTLFPADIFRRMQKQNKRERDIITHY